MTCPSCRTRMGTTDQYCSGCEVSMDTLFHVTCTCHDFSVICGASMLSRKLQTVLPFHRMLEDDDDAMATDDSTKVHPGVIIQQYGAIYLIGSWCCVGIWWLSWLFVWFVWRKMNERNNKYDRIIDNIQWPFRCFQMLDILYIHFVDDDKHTTNNNNNT